MTSTPADASTLDGTDKPARPRTVDLALYAIVARCVLLLATALLEIPYHDQLVERTRRLNPKATETAVQAAVPSATQGLITAVIGIALVLMVAKFIRDGKNWARILFSVLVVLLFRDVFGLSALLAKDYPLPLRISVALTGLAAIVAVSLLFVRPSAPYFRRTGPAPTASPLGSLFRPRTAGPAAGPAVGRTAAPAVVSKADRAAAKSRASGPSLTKQRPATNAAATPAVRPRGKSRKAEEV